MHTSRQERRNNNYYKRAKRISRVGRSVITFMSVRCRDDDIAVFNRRRRAGRRVVGATLFIYVHDCFRAKKNIAYMGPAPVSNGAQSSRQ